MKAHSRSLSIAAASVVAASLIQPVMIQPAHAAPTMNGAFDAAAKKYDVPRDLLVALAYSETHLDGHKGKPSGSAGYGVMHLQNNVSTDMLERAAKLTGKSMSTLSKDDTANIHGGAAILRSYANKAGLRAKQRDDIGRWYPAVAKYSQAKQNSTARLYADTVFEFLKLGVKATTPSGERVTVKAQKPQPRRGNYAKVRDMRSAAAANSEDYPAAIWNPASPSNYQVANGRSITKIIIHVTQGSYAGTISWFKNPSAQVSAHYVIRSNDGEVTQMVRNKDIAWHVRNANPYTIGIEHEGFVNDASWFTDAMYRSSAALTKHTADKHGIPKDRAHIQGHNEIPGNDHTDPGPHWDWNKYIGLVGGDPGDPQPGKYYVDTFAAAPGHSSPGGTRTGTLNAGTNYVFCRAWGPEVRQGDQFNHWWMKTDLDSGNPWQGQWVSAFYLKKWGNDEAKDNSGRDLPNC